LRYKSFIQDKARGHIVLVHGYGERIEKLMEMGFDFHQAGFNVFAFDQRGYGRSTRLNPERKDSIYVDRFEDYVLDLEQFIVEVVEPQGQRPTFIFAHSMGGLVSTMLLHRRPDLIDGAILSAPMLSIDLKGVPRFMALLLAQVANGLGFGASYAFGQIGPRKPEYSETSGTHSQARWQFYADFYASPEEWPLSLGGASFHWLGEALRSSVLVDDDAWASLIQTPVLLFQADQDTYVSPEGQNAFCSRAPRCQKIFIPGTRHEIYREQDGPRASYMNRIHQFLDELTRPGQNPATHP
jgi:lysophospholipase